MKQDEYEYDTINGEHKKKTKLRLLNKAKVSSFELDALFGDLDEEL